MDMEDALKKSVECIKSCVTFLDKVTEKHLNKERLDLIVTLTTFLDSAYLLINEDDEDGSGDKDYDDVEQKDYDDVEVDGQLATISQQATATIPPVPCSQLLTPAIAGTLEIKRKALMKGAWAKRWCVIQQNILYMYEHSNDKKQKEAFYLNGFSINITDEITKETKRKERCFELKNKQTGKVYDFCATDKDSVYKWKQNIEKAAPIDPSTLTTLNTNRSPSTKLDKKHALFSKSPISKRKSFEEHASDDKDDIYVDTEGPIQGRLLYTDTGVDADAVEETYVDNVVITVNEESEETYDDVSAPTASPAFNKFSGNRNSTSAKGPVPPIPPQKSFGSRSSATLPRPSSLKSEGKSTKPPPLPPNKNAGIETVKSPSWLAVTPDTGAGLPFSTPLQNNLKRNSSKRSSVASPLNMEEEDEKYKDVDISELYQGMWDCQADDDNELCFSRGQIVHVISKKYDHHGWWIAKRDENVGLVPTEYLMEAYEK